MSTNLKKDATEIIDTLPDDATWDDLMYEIYVRQAIEAGIADLNAGRKVSTDELRREFQIPK
ncbi:MAG TPA: hypothetical protein VGF48_08315 [Thermoanaerobaculia bacterium]|jgi:predicted transcriptional regulator